MLCIKTCCRDEVPRRIQIERKRRIYESHDLNSMLDGEVQRLCDDCVINIGGDDSIPISIRCLDLSAQTLPLSMFDDTSYDCHPIKLWKQMIDGTGGATIRCWLQGSWQYGKAISYDGEMNAVEVILSQRNEKNSFKLPRMFVCFDSENPEDVIKRISCAIQARAEVESVLLFHLCVDCMPVDGVPSYDIGQVSKILRLATATLSKGAAAPDTAGVIHEASLRFMRTMNMLQLLHEGKKLQLPNAESDPILSSLRWDFIFKSMEMKQHSDIHPDTIIPCVSMTKGQALSAFSFKTMLTSPESIQVMQFVERENIMLMSRKLFSSPEKCLKLDEYIKLQTIAINETNRYIRETWVGSIVRSVKSEFRCFNKGWLNLSESNTEVYNFSKIKRFLQLVNFKMEDTLRFFLTSQLDSFVKFIADVCNGKMTHPLFYVDLMLLKGENGGQYFSTTDSGLIISKHMAACMEYIFNSIHDIVRIEKHIMTQLFWGTEPKMTIVSIHEDSIQSSMMSVIQLLNHSMQQVEAFCSSFAHFEPLLSVDVDGRIDGYLKEFGDENGVKISELKKCALEHLHERDSILSSVTEEVIVGPIVIRCQNIRKLLAKKHQDIHDKLILTIIGKVRQESEKVVENFNGTLTKITRKPSTIEEMVELKEYIAQNVPQQYQDYKQMAEKAYANYAIIDSLKLQIFASDLNLKWEVFGWPKKLTDTLRRLEYDLDMLRERLLQSMQEQKGEFSERLRGIRSDISNLQSQYDISRVSQISSRVRNIQRELERADEEARLINSREGLFGKDVTDFAEISEVKKLLEPFLDLWTSVDHWLISQREWKEGPFLDLDAELIEKQVSVLSKNLSKAFRSFERNQQTSCCKIASEFRDRVNDFKPYVPLIVALRNPGMKERHWNLLTEKTGISIQVSQSLTLSKLVAKGIVDQITTVSKISETAAKEYAIEMTLDKMDNAWKTMILIIDAYRSTGTFILKGIDDLITLLDEQITTTQAMAFSAFKGPFGERIDSWNECLSRVSEVVEEWIQVQRSWLYLQPIFDSEDINRQLPAEGKRFASVDKFWRQTMSAASREVLAIRFCNDQRLLDKFRESNRMLEMVQKGLSDYLETKRAGFARFYFLSNDELLEILSESKDPLRVQPHLKKCFEGIKSVDFSSDLTITAMNSAEGEKIAFNPFIDPKGKNVENWMVEVNDGMINNIKTSMGEGIRDYLEVKRTDWVQKWPGQVVLNGSQVHWTREVEEKMKAEGNNGVHEYADQLSGQLSDMVILIRGRLSKMARITIGALAVIDVHARDVVRNMANANVAKITDFDWISQMRFYWEGIGGDFDLKVVMVSSKRSYGYEYLGNTPRLVITPLTDKCYLTLMGALQMILGGAPAGPAGTGKTETVKDLSKALAKQCVVFNCSDGLDYLAMGKFFKGLANCGAWSCFDEFNRINIEVLSVIAQQIMTLQGAVQRKEKKIVFEGTDIIVSPEFAVFITMNPGYAGRTELPDNLEALFRPVAMMVPDYVLIAEISLFSYGYMEGRKCAEKMVATFRLCSEQLSSQDHYDYGMRAVKTVITAAGNLKRVSPDENEEALLLRALQDVNIPKFLAHDLPLFSGILSDLFPGTIRPAFDYGPLLRSLKASAEKNGLQPVPNFLRKNIELYEMICVRHGLMVVGPTGGGKSMNINMLKDALSNLHKEGIKGVRYEKVQKYELNPKSVTMGQLYGEFDVNTHEWRDGILCGIVRDCIRQQNTELKWVVFGGPVDALWIESMNTVLDDNKKLCLTSGEIMSLSEEMTMMFEPEDLAVASPATVSRCGMIYMEPTSLGLDPLIWSWLQRLPKSLDNRHISRLQSLFDTYFIGYVSVLRRLCVEPFVTVNTGVLESLFNLLDCFLAPFENKEGVEPKPPSDFTDLFTLMEPVFLFCMIWSVCCTVNEKGRRIFDMHLRSEMKSNKSPIPFPDEGTIYDYLFMYDERRWVLWTDSVQPYQFDNKLTFFEITVPTLDSICYSHLLNTCLANCKHFLLTGPTGTGKTVNISRVLQRSLPETYIPITLMFSAQTSANQTQDMIDSKCEKRRKDVYGPAAGKKFVIFVDDVNMPQKEFYGSQPPIELLRQWYDAGGWFDRKALTFRKIIDVIFVAACGHPGGGRNAMTARFCRHFNIINCTDMSKASMNLIFTTILSGFLSTFDQSVSSISSEIVQATIGIYSTIVDELRPTPAKCHYTFNLRDISKIFQGLLMLNPRKVSNDVDLCRYWIHECRRVFADRLVNDNDRNWFEDLMAREFQNCVQTKTSWKTVMDRGKNVICGDFMNPGSDVRIYEEIKDLGNLQPAIEEFLNEYNSESKQPMNLVLFMDALQHVSRLSRVLRQPQGNMLLLGVGGSGRQSLTRLSTFIAGYKIFQIEIAKGYGVQNWREDVRDCLLQAGADNCQVVFLFNDTQIINETMLEDINNILNSGDVPNLYGPEEIERITSACKPECVKKKLPPTKLNIFAQYLLRVRSNIHLVLCMSPMSEKFRERMRKFPSVINCCTIDWFSEWPDEALSSVATKILVESGISFEGHEESVIEFVRYVHQSVSAASKQFLLEVKRYNFVTPTSFLELLSTYQKVINEKRLEVGTLKQRLKIGLEKLVSTAEQVEALQAQLVEMEPQLVKTQDEVEQMIIQIDHDRAEAAEVQKIVQEEESSAKHKAEETKAIADDAQRDLDEALPALDEAVACLKDLKKSDIDEVRAMSRPPSGVKLTMEATCIMFGIKPVKVNDPDIPGRKINDYFQAAQRSVLQDAKKLLEDMQNFDKDNIPDAVISAIDSYINSEDFTPDKVANASKACKAMCMWVRAMFKYHHVARMVEPKKRLLAQAQASLEITLAALAQAQIRLKINLERLERLQNEFNEANSRKEQLARDVLQCRERLDRAQKLMKGLGGERIRWGESCNRLETAYGKLVGDALVCASTIAYAGPFTPEFRKRIVSDWRENMVRHGIPHTEGCDLRAILGDPVQLRQWNLFNLPADNHSTENAIILSKSRRYPLFIDPQAQANRFIRSMGKDASLCPNGMDITKLSDKNFLRTIENGVRFGRWVLLENVGEELDAAIEPLLLQQKFKQGGQEMIKIGDSTIPWNDSFKFFMTSKLPNPRYPAEVCVKVSLLNFAVTFSGLEDQLLGVVVVEEMPEMEKKKNELVVNNARMKKELKDIEDKILHLLSVSQGNILDDHQLIEILASSKKTSDEIIKKVMEAEVTETEIDRIREGFRPVAFRGSILFFMISDLSTIDPMYQFSAQWFTGLFVQAIKKSEPSPEIEKRISNMNDFFTYYTYVNICRGLFERHKLLLSFLMTIRILQGKNGVDDRSWQFLLMGKVVSSVKTPKDHNPDSSWIDNRMWSEILELSKLSTYSGLLESFQLPSKVMEWKKIYDSSDPHVQTLPCGFSDKLGSLEKICITRCIRADKCPEAITNFVLETMGKKYVEPPPFDLESCFKDSTPTSPLVFILSKGSDPTKAFYQFAARVKMDKKVKGLSLGQGQGEKATKMIEEAVQKGHWVYLQNCHLYISWLTELERLCESIQPDAVHRDFRLWLTSMPCKEFPVSILQNGVKMTNEPPRGLKANLKNAFFKLNNDSLSVTSKPHEYKKLLFGLCFFHAAVQERRKFGPLGWNIPYDFNDTDLDISRGQLELFLDSYSDIPFKVLTFLTSYINYGGRVTDYIDLRGIDVIMKCYYVPDILRDDYKFESSGTYYSVPVNNDDAHKGYMDYIDQLPLSANPEVFGLHENANITSALNETFDTFDLLASLQASGGGASKTSESREEILGKIVTDIQTKIGKLGKFDIDAISMIYPVRYEESMNTVLIQECIRYNKLIQALLTTLPELLKAVKGLVVMSAELEAISNSLFVNQVPANWESKAYPSLKPLAAWTDDLVLRLQFVSNWIETGIPSVFWISGFFFPQAFLTGALQNFARKYSFPIDTVTFGFKFLTTPWENIKAKAVDGVYVRGLFLEGARWDEDDGCLSTSMPKQLYTSLPVIHLFPEQNREAPKSKIYRCPVYKVLSRRGTLSTTGHSTNFIMWIEVPSNMKSMTNNQGFPDDEVWIRAGVAAFCSLRY